MRGIYIKLLVTPSMIYGGQIWETIQRERLDINQSEYVAMYASADTERQEQERDYYKQKSERWIYQIK